MRALPPFALLAALSCGRTVYPTPTATSATPMHAPDEAPASTSAARDRLATLERQCRARPVGTAASLSAVDEMRTALGSLCTVESVDNDPLLWLFRCQTDAFFPLGQYDFPERGSHACSTDPTVHGTNGWVCAGAALQRLIARPDSGIESARAVFVGHVDEVHLQPAQSFQPCATLTHAWHYADGDRWEPLPHGDPRLDVQGNNQLAWCRAASVAQQVLCGMQQLGGPTRGRSAPLDCARVTYDPHAHAALSVGLVGASTLWQQRQEAATCPQCAGAGTATQCACNAARRVDVFVQFQPRERTVTTSPCAAAAQGNDDSRALYCLQECLEGRSVLAEELQVQRHDLFRTCDDAAAASPTGWLEQATPSGAGASSCVRVDRDLLRRVIGL